MRCVEALNGALHEAFEQRDDVVLIGEDVLDPYGGAFKVTRGPQRALARSRPDDAHQRGVPLRRRGRNGDPRPAARARDHVRRLRRARLRSDRERDREVPGDVRRAGHRAARRANADGRPPRLRPDAQPVAREAAGRGAGHRRRRHQRVPRPPRPAPRGDRRRAPGLLRREQAHVRTAQPPAGGRLRRRLPVRRVGRAVSRAHVLRQRARRRSGDHRHLRGHAPDRSRGGLGADPRARALLRGRGTVPAAACRPGAGPRVRRAGPAPW